MVLVESTLLLLFIGVSAGISIVNFLMPKIYATINKIERKYVERTWNSIGVSLAQNEGKFKRIMNLLYDKFQNFRLYNNVKAIQLNDSKYTNYYIPLAIFDFSDKIKIQPIYSGGMLVELVIWSKSNDKQYLYDFDTKISVLHSYVIQRQNAVREMEAQEERQQNISHKNE